LTLSLHDALPIWPARCQLSLRVRRAAGPWRCSEGGDRPTILVVLRGLGTGPQGRQRVRPALPVRRYARPSWTDTAPGHQLCSGAAGRPRSAVERQRPEGAPERAQGRAGGTDGARGGGRPPARALRADLRRHHGQARQQAVVPLRSFLLHRTAPQLSRPPGVRRGRTGRSPGLHGPVAAGAGDGLLLPGRHRHRGRPVPPERPGQDGCHGMARRTTVPPLRARRRRTAGYCPGSTDREAARARPNDVVKMAVMEWLVGRGYRRYVLGGGVRPGDGLERYKKGFAPDGGTSSRTAERVLDPAGYAALVQ